MIALGNGGESMARTLANERLSPDALSLIHRSVASNVGDLLPMLCNC
jgi:hypothetical protein